MILNLYYDNKIVKIDSDKIINSISIGNKQENDVLIHNKKFKSNFMIQNKNEKLYLISTNGNDITYKNEKINNKLIKNQDLFILGKNNEIIIFAYEKDVYTELFIDFDLNNKNQISIGRSENNDIVIKKNIVSSKHAVIKRSKSNEMYIFDNGSTNGVFVNNKRVEKAVLKKGDTIDILEYSIKYFVNYLSINGVEKDVYVNLNRFVDINRNKINIKSNSKVTGNNKKGIYFKKPPRIVPTFPNEIINIENPPPMPSKAQKNWIRLLVMPIIMIIVGITTYFLLKRGLYVFISITMTFITTIFNISDYLGKVKKYKVDMRERREKYVKYLNEQRNKIEKLVDIQKRNSWLIHPDVLACCQILKSRNNRLWERETKHSDYLKLRIGIGNDSFNAEIKVPNKNMLVDEDDLIIEQQKIKDDYKYITGMPKCLDLLKEGVTGIIGKKDLVEHVANLIIMQAITFHAYDMLKIVFVIPKSDLEKWKWVRWLPHVWNKSKSKRFIIFDEESSSALNEVLDILKENSADNKNRKASSEQTKVLMFISEASIVEREMINSLIDDNCNSLGLAPVYLLDALESLPSSCSTIVSVEAEKAQISNKDGKYNDIMLKVDNFNFNNLEKLARTISPVILKNNDTTGEIPKRVSFLEIFDVESVEELNVWNNWNHNNTFKSIGAPLGINKSGNLIELDLHEKFHGPHGLVAGTTGSGKSELLQSYILSVAINYHPHYISFVIIDYKGGGMANCFMGLPHVIGTITNLGGNETNRALVSIKSEIKRRQGVLSDYGLNHIDKYQEIYKIGKAKQPLSHLVIIVDEFAELKADNPGFMKELVSAARVGRSLGVHLILATQKPAGIVDDQIWTNSRFKLCLKVQDISDSKGMLKRPEAAYIKEPGRCYLQVGNNEIFELFQSAWSGASYLEGEVDKEDIEIKEVMITGERKLKTLKNKPIKSSSEKTQLSYIVNYIKKLSKIKKIKPLDGPWLPPLPDSLFLDEVNTLLKVDDLEQDGLSCNVGIIDDPENQRQIGLKIDFEKDSHMAVYGMPGSGKSVFIQTVVMAFCKKYTSEEINFYLMDFGGRSFSYFADLPHVGGIVFGDEEEKLSKLMKLLIKIVDERKKLFSDEGVGNIKSYYEYTGKKIPNIVIVVDNYATLRELYPDYMEIFLSFSRYGSNVGLNLILTMNSASSLHYKLAVNIKNAITFQLASKSDYLPAVGQTFGLEPKSVCGRGLIKMKPPLEFQAALSERGFSEIERLKKLKISIKDIASSWNGDIAKRIPELKEIIEFDEVMGRKDVYNIINNNKNISFAGFDDEDCEPVYINYDSMKNILIIKGGDSKINYLNSLVISLLIGCEKDDIELDLIDSSDASLLSFSKLKFAKFYSCEEKEINNFFEELDNILDIRKGKLIEERIQKEEMFSEEEFLNKYKRKIIVIDDFGEFNQILKRSSKVIVERLIRKDNNLGVNLIVNTIATDIQSCYDAHAKALKERQNGVVLGNPFSQQVLNIKKQYGKNVKHSKTDGYIVYGGLYKKIKLPIMTLKTLKKYIDLLK